MEVLNGLTSQQAADGVTLMVHDLGRNVPLQSYVPFYHQFPVKNYQLTNLSPPKSINVVLGFSPSNYSELQSFLQSLSNPASPMFHKYLSKSYFDQRFGGARQAYLQTVSFLKTEGISNITAYADRLSISFSASSQKVGGLFNTTIREFKTNSGVFFSAMSTPELPAAIADNITSIFGLSDYSKFTVSLAPLTYALKNSSTGAGSPATAGPYPAPINRSGTQYLFGSDMQVAYQSNQLFKQFGYPTDMVEATILWSGSYTGLGVNTKYGYLPNGTLVGPYYPSDVYAYFNQTLPKGEPHSTVYGVPVGNAPPPGYLASYDSSSANVENTLDLEMLGSLAPGSKIFNVYSSSPTQANLDQELGTILNPSSDPALNASLISSLNEVSVISNSWGSNDTYDPIWSFYLQEAQSRGITVLAASGDSGDSPQSASSLGTIASFPASAANDTFGVVSVGGVTVTLNSSLSISSQINWYDLNTTDPTNTFGTQSGISSVYKEPSWQKNSLADQLINGKGRGIPDISALANNTIMTITIDGETYNSSDLPYGVTFAAVMGTSISSPIVGGIIAEVDHALFREKQGLVGFLDPTLYALGDMQFTSPIGSSGTFIHLGTSYNSSLPVLPFYPVTVGQNTIYHDRYGYSLLNGWGTLNAYNFTSSIMNLSYAGNAGFLSGAFYNVSLDALNASLQDQKGNSVSGSNYTIVISAAIADSTGQPVYLVSGSVSFLWTSPGTFSENFTASLSYPFENLGTGERLAVVKDVALGTILLPGNLNLSIGLNTASSLLERTVKLQAGSWSVSFNVPLAAYIVGKLNYSYFYQGIAYFDGPVPDNYVTGGLDPQLTIGSGNALNISVAHWSVSGVIVSGIKGMGSSTWSTPGTTVVNKSNVLNPTRASNFGYSRVSNNTWNLYLDNGSSALGIASYVNGNYLVTFLEQGLPSGAGWYLNISGMVPSIILGEKGYSVVLTNGSYSFSAVSENKTYAPTSNESIVVSGENLTVTIHFAILRFNITFVETGLGPGVTWTLAVPGLNSSGPLNKSTYSLRLPNGTYSYSVTRSSNAYSASSFSGTFAVSGSDMDVSITFFSIRYTVVLRETGLDLGQRWTITFNGVNYTINGTSITLVLSNGSYSYSVPAIPGYSISNPTGVVVVNGCLTDLVITFSKPSNFDWGLLIDLGIGSLIVLAAAYLIYRKKGKS